MNKTRTYGALPGANSDDKKPRRMGAQPGGKAGRYGSQKRSETVDSGRDPRHGGRPEGGYSSEARPRRRTENTYSSEARPRRTENTYSSESRPRRAENTYSSGRNTRDNNTFSDENRSRRPASRRDDTSFSGEARPRRTDARPVRRGEGGGHFSESRSQRPSRFRNDDDRPTFTRRPDDRKPFERRPRIDRGPWGESAYRVTQKVAVKPIGAPADIKVTASDAETSTKPSDGKERLQKVLARSGVASRRNAEVLILEGAVTVNGRTITELGTKVDPINDKIKVSGKLIYTDVEPIYAAIYKPRGVISSLGDPEGRPHIGQIVASLRERVVPIGRLDFTSEGLILMTNDGDLAEKIFKERELPKLYMVKVKGHPTEKDLDFLKRGIFSAEGVVRFASYGVEQTLRGKSWLKLEVTDGSKLDLRELLNHRGLLVDRIVRTAIGTISIQGLNPGEYRLMKRQDFLGLLK